MPRRCDRLQGREAGTRWPFLRCWSVRTGRELCFFALSAQVDKVMSPTMSIHVSVSACIYSYISVYVQSGYVDERRDLSLSRERDARWSLHCAEGHSSSAHFSEVCIAILKHFIVEAFKTVRWSDGVGRFVYQLDFCRCMCHHVPKGA